MIDAHALTLKLKGKWHGASGSAPCPVCQPERRPDQGALSLKDGVDGRLLLHCFKSGCDFRAILAASDVSATEIENRDSRTPAHYRGPDRGEGDRRVRQARSLWNETYAIKGTVAERYLREARGINCDLPATLRYHPACWHPSGSRYPALIAAVEGSDSFGVHRTYVRPDGAGKAPISRPKTMLGAVKGGAVRLTNGVGPVLVAEGIETAFSAWILRGCVGMRVWAALSTVGMKAVLLPDAPGSLVIAPDGDRAGRAAGLALADRACRNGWTVSILTPPRNGDFNDLLRNEVMK